MSELIEYKNTVEPSELARAAESYSAKKAEQGATVKGVYTFPVEEPEPQKQPEKSGGIEVRKNEEKNGIEIRFPSKPDQNILEQLKRHGFRWSSFQGIWWNRYTEQGWQFANAL